ncbi:hypothetical protein [Nocardioides rubriscoriae]|uniref:hypothetical protein n=1 Tax=Nocardioides rubriscoriae TaxID=642762 RepID=UPI0011DFDFB2|nr:hypothetical protein [Nocardioides rubriscoriae]
MTQSVHEGDSSPTIELCVYREGELLARELCESEEDAAEAARRWAETGNVTFTVDDVSFRHSPEDVLAPEPAGWDDDEPAPADEPAG